NIPDRVMEEIITEGSMLFEGVDIDMRFGPAISISEYLKSSTIYRDISSKRKINFDDPLASKRKMHRLALKIMQSYMSSIYGLTTVNYDNIFASVLRALPFSSISERDYKLKIFLALARIHDLRNIYYHDALLRNPIHLITDDLYGKYKDFMSVAVEKGVVTIDDTVITKDRSQFSSPYKFHRARIEHPIEVMANAVEPLVELEKAVKRVAWMPVFFVRRKVAEHLIRKAEIEYCAEYKAYYKEGESNDKSFGKPLFLKGNKKDTGILLVHSYLSVPAELEKLAKYLNGKGYYVYIPRLKGHGTSPVDLADRAYVEWLDSAEEGYAALSIMCSRVIIGGFSSGSPVVFELAERIQEIAGIIAVNPLFRLNDLSERIIPKGDVLLKMLEKINIIDAHKEFHITDLAECKFCYNRNPDSGILELEKLLRIVNERLGEVKAPVYILQSKKDPMLDTEGVNRLFERIGSDDKEYMIIDSQRHDILSGEGNEEAFKMIDDFIIKLK
ncbi:alpha/beta hydrolase, partial [Spirochaetota bacterium]